MSVSVAAVMMVGTRRVIMSGIVNDGVEGSAAAVGMVVGVDGAAASMDGAAAGMDRARWWW